MRELERRPSAPSVRTPGTRRVAIVGAGRLGTAMAAGLRRSGVAVDGPLGRDEPLPDRLPDVILLCVPDAAIATAARAIPGGPVLGHCSGATGLEAFGDRPAFSLHPLMTVPAGAPPDVLAGAGAGAAIDATTPSALALADELARVLGMRPVRVAPEDRAAYHAAASIAANFLVTLEAAAERLAATAGLERTQLLPLVRATVESWAALGPERALTGPVARGDEATVVAQREAVAQRAPELLELFDALADATRRLAGREAVAC